MIHLVMTLISSLIAGIVSQSLSRLLFGLLISPLRSSIVIAIVTFFFFYSFLFFFQRKVEFKSIATILVISQLPFAVLHGLAPLFPPIDLAGMAFVGLLLIVGFTDALQLPKVGVIRLLASVYIVAFLVWAFALMQREKRSQEYSPQSLEEIQDESYD